MKDKRLLVFRTALEGLLESLNAFVRLTRWSDADSPPEPLRIAASKLVDRLGAAERLAAGKFQGTAREVESVTTMCVAMRKLDAAYLKYRRRTDAAPERITEATSVLEAEVGEAAAAAGY